MATVTVITNIGAEKILKARAGLITLPKVAGFVFGDGGVDNAGNVLLPDRSQDGLNNEIIRKPYAKVEEISRLDYRYTVTLGAEDVPGKKISEIGLYDTDGDVICIRNFSAKEKDEDIEQTYAMDDVF